MLRRLIMLSAVLLVVFASAAHAQYVPGQPGFIINPDTIENCVAATTDVVATGIGAPPNTLVTFTIDGTVVGTTTSGNDTDGGFEATLHIPALPEGEYTVVATSGSVRMTNLLTITCNAATTAAGTLPRTGSDSLLFVRAGIALVAVGGLLVLGARKRRASV